MWWIKGEDPPRRADRREAQEEITLEEEGEEEERKEGRGYEGRREKERERERVAVVGVREEAMAEITATPSRDR